MVPSDRTTRRRFGLLAGATATLGPLAGCGGPEPDDEDEDEPEFEDGADDGRDIDTGDGNGTDGDSANESGTEPETGADGSAAVDADTGPVNGIQRRLRRRRHATVEAVSILPSRPIRRV